MLPTPLANRLAGYSPRTRRLLLGSAATFVGRGASTVMTLATTALVARSLPAGDFGFWTVMTGLPALAAQLDLGVGNALRNKLAALAAAPGQEGRARVYFFSSLNAFLAAAALLSAAGAALSFLLPFSRWMSADVSHLGAAAAPLAAGACFALFFSLALSLGNFGLYAYQESHVSALMETLRSLLILVFSAGVWALRLQTAAMTSAYFLGFLAAAGISLLAFLHLRKWAWSVPGWEETAAIWRELRAASSGFFLLQVSAAVILYTDAILVARVAGFGSAGEYALVQKIFLYLIAVQVMVLVPLWSAFTDAHARGDHGWLRRMFLRAFWLTLAVTGGGGLFLTAAGRGLIRLWTGKQVADAGLFPVMALWAFVYGWSNCFSVPLNAVGKVRRQALLSFAGAVVNVPLALYWGKAWGPVGVCWAAIVVVAPVAVSNTLEVVSFLRSHAD